jgi:hypothetical protein
MMDSQTTLYGKRVENDTTVPVDSSSELSSNSMIYIEPEKEAAALKKFDKYLVPVSLIFIILSALDRNNVSEAYVP